MSPKTLAELLDVAVTTLQEWRDQGYGPRWFKLGRLVRYRLDEVWSWVESLEAAS
ncbi:helix-turn-helix transcriptional regulator [Gulosibacter faecalis]|uniref:Helix-turn-helix transcriptional regulator n=1 Tax=Gulosibacter faecalis TaxID=272240 RepID=A0ABW5UV18_9MICO